MLKKKNFKQTMKDIKHFVSEKSSRKESFNVKKNKNLNYNEMPTYPAK